MKVLHVLNELKPSGAEVMLRCAAPLWAAHGVHSDILSTGAQEGVYAGALREAGYAVHHLPSAKHPLHFLRLGRFIRSSEYDLVHLHAEGASYWTSLTALAAGCPVVRTVHQTFPFDGWLRRRRAWQRRHLQRLGVRFVAIAEGVRRNEAWRFGLDSALVWNWLDIARFGPVTPQERYRARSAWGFREEHVVTLTLGNCSHVKNHAALIEALARCSDLPALRYLHVGLPDVMHSEEPLADRLGQRERIVFAGWQADPRPALAAADVFVMPSLYEGLGISAMEALACGLPAILADVPGLQDLQMHFPGLRYCTPDAAGLEQALRTCVAEGPARWRRTAAGYPDVARARFAPERGVAEYAGIYREVQARRRASTPAAPPASEGIDHG